MSFMGKRIRMLLTLDWKIIVIHSWRDIVWFNYALTRESQTTSPVQLKGTQKHTILSYMLQIKVRLQTIILPRYWATILSNFLVGSVCLFSSPSLSLVLSLASYDRDLLWRFEHGIGMMLLHAFYVLLLGNGYVVVYIRVSRQCLRRLLLAPLIIYLYLRLGVYFKR